MKKFILFCVFLLSICSIVNAQTVKGILVEGSDDDTPGAEVGTSANPLKVSLVSGGSSLFEENAGITQPLSRSTDLSLPGNLSVFDTIFTQDGKGVMFAGDGDGMEYYYDKDLNGLPTMVIRPEQPGRECRISVMPKGDPTLGVDTLIAGIKIFGTDYVADTANNSDIGLYTTSTDFRFNSKKNGTGVNKNFVFSVQDTSRLWELNVSDGRIKHNFAKTHYLSTLSKFNEYVSTSNVDNGDTIVLPSGNLSVSVAMDVTKAITIKGQGVNNTRLFSGTNDLNVFNVTSDGVVIQDLAIDLTSGGTTNRAIYFNGASSSVFDNCVVRNVSVQMSGAGSQTAVNFGDAGGIIDNLDADLTSSSSLARGVYMVNLSTADAVTKAIITDCKITTKSAASYSRPFYVDDASSNNDAIMNLYNCVGTALETGAGSGQGAAANAGDSILNAYNCVFSGTDQDVADISSGGVTLQNCILVNKTTTGTITSTGQLRSGDILISPSSGTDLNLGADLTTDGTNLYWKGQTVTVV